MTLQELKKIQEETYAEVQRIEIEILEPRKEEWRKAYRAVEEAEKEAKIEAEVQRRLQERSAK